MSKHTYGAAPYDEQHIAYPNRHDMHNHTDNNHGYNSIQLGDPDGIGNGVGTPNQVMANDPQLPFDACMFAYGRGFTFNHCKFTLGTYFTSQSPLQEEKKSSVIFFFHTPADHISVPNATLRGDTPDQRRPATSNHVNDHPEDKKKDPGNNIDWTPIAVGAALLVLAGGCIAFSTTRKLAWRPMWTGL
ncbi:hypothetical protein CC1G_02300 [Coprinopsis cinerea okayama7|uniref:Uncharacterized protein n=1 Tax=Coprinopsis cinerea (strain Okayama-7 / 130 / ATCC MYA-4618 / FGSC 9003) TaxID=240176 RepID=A8N7P3_COPC7|nr:hypothetical protein CC1G_02300 [Coprinopsis cinerea okayama7\|eukprot:XP_001830849.2 hypothetical protein CC1G_02300 [Coprinopsis cinerea okayama7\